MAAEYLPELLDLNGDTTETLEMLYDVFSYSFVTRTINHEDAVVLYDSRKLDGPASKEEAFWHLVSRDTYSPSGRTINFRRAERLSWARPLIVNSYPEVTIFDFDHTGKKGIRRYIWSKDGRYVIVLAHRKNETYFLITAYYVDKSGEIDLERRLRMAL